MPVVVAFLTALFVLQIIFLNFCNQEKIAPPVQMAGD
jgi:hypothetical protein